MRGVVAAVLVTACGDVGTTTSESSGTGEETSTTSTPPPTTGVSGSTGAPPTSGVGTTDASSTHAITATDTADTRGDSSSGSTGSESTGSDPGGASSSTGGDSSGGDTGGTSSSTGGDTSGGDTSGGDTTGGVQPVSCDVGEWTCVPVEPDIPYGTRSLKVPAAQNWVNTGLYLMAGQKATLTVEGTWSLGANEGKTIDHGTCLIGDFVARLGLLYKDTALHCISGMATITAEKSGILYVGALPSNDLGETYESRLKATGAKNVTITSTGATVPFIAAEDAADYPYDQVASGWVEISGVHTILTLPTDTAKQDAAELAPAIDRIDLIYELHTKMRGANALPHQGQRIRWISDLNVKQFAYMLAGNPIRMDPVLVSKNFAHRISIASKPGVDVWGFAHELGHDFTFPNGVWWYQEKSLESWPNLFSIHALSQLGIPLHKNYLTCPGSSPVNYAAWDAWSGLCFLMQFQYAYGWEHFYAFFAVLNATPGNQVPSGPNAWNFVHNVFETVAKQDVTPVFKAWGVPNPG